MKTRGMWVERNRLSSGEKDLMCVYNMNRCIQKEDVQKSSVHVKLTKCQSGGSLRYGCDMSSVVVARSSGLLNISRLTLRRSTK